jgi:hypothetical protein
MMDDERDPPPIAVQPDIYALLLLPQMEQNQPPGQAPAEQATKAAGPTSADEALGAVGVDTSEEQRQPRITGFEDQANSDLATIRTPTRSAPFADGKARSPTRVIRLLDRHLAAS